MHRFARPVLAAALLLAAAAPAAAQLAATPLTARYEAELARQCPEKHLERLNPGTLADASEEFFHHLKPKQRAVEQMLMEKACAKVEAGASCGNHAILKTADRLGMMPELATAVCHLHYACTAPFECQETHP